ncbi:MAG: response regulator transcription factor [Lachnospiraceae bacterium]|nr:response regulator transcription factor [Lachnospiraceae bacterium]
MTFGIVEDEQVWAERIKQEVERKLFSLMSDFKVLTFNNPEDAEELCEKVDFWFLDVDLGKGKDGFALAEKIKRPGNDAVVCFLTSHVEYARDGYRVSAYRYIDKSHLEEIGEALETWMDSEVKETDIPCQTENGIVFYRSKRILYIETEGRKLKYHLDCGECVVGTGTVGKTVERIEQHGFYMIHRSFIINLQHVRKADSRKITLSDGTIIPVSRERYQGFKESFFYWRRDHAV